MKAVILAAGEGARMGPFTASGPKVMIPVANRPILEYVVAAVVGAGIRDIVVVTGYRRERILNHFQDGKAFGANLEYVAQGKQLGTAHALLAAREKVEGDMLVLPGDNLIDSALLSDFLAKHEGGTSLLVAESEDPRRYGVVEVTDGALRRLVEKPSQRISNLVSTGIYAFPRAVFEEIAALGEAGRHDLTDVVQELLQRQTVRAPFATGLWIDAGYPWDLVEANAAALQGLQPGKAGTIEKGVTVRGKVSIGEGSTLRAGTYIQGPAVLGEGCDIGPNAVLLGATSLGDDVRVGPFATIENSLLMNDVAVGASSVLQSCVAGAGVRGGPGLLAAAGGASVEIEGEWHAIERVGAMIGEDTVLGEGVVVEPGSVLGVRCDVRAGARVRGRVPNGTTVM